MHMPVMLANWEPNAGRLRAQGQLRQHSETPI
jgi:hypothetical protein